MIYAKRPFVMNQVNMKIESEDGNKEISIACDDSCGAFEDLLRSDIKCYYREVDVTDHVFKSNRGRITLATVKTLKKALNWLNKE